MPNLRACLHDPLVDAKLRASTDVAEEVLFIHIFFFVVLARVALLTFILLDVHNIVYCLAHSLCHH